MKIGWGIAFGVACGLLGAGLLLLLTSPPHGEAVPLLPAPTPAPLIVHVTGAVLHPGNWAVPRGSRVNDAILAAGGLLPEADGQALNLAAILEDGQRVFVPIKSTPAPVSSEPSTRSSQLEIATPTPAFPININTATKNDLDALPGIGPSTAEKIITYRNEHGIFVKIEDIQDVPGIGPATFDNIKGLITVGDASVTEQP